MECGSQQRPQGRPGPPPRPPPPGASATGASQQHQETSLTFSSFQALHERAFAAVQAGLKADEDGDEAAAERHYTSSLPLMNQVLGIDCGNMTGATAAEKDSAVQMQQKMNKTQLQISYRLESFKDELERSLDVSQPECTGLEETGVRLPSYDEAVSDSGSHSSLMAEAALGDSIMSAEYSVTRSDSFLAEGTEIFSVPEGVQIFHITTAGYVSAPSYPTSMHIVRLHEGAEGGEEAAGSPPAFIHVGDWVYPLVPGRSPVLHTQYHAYLFPDLSTTGASAGSSVGMLLPEGMSEDEKRTLSDILYSLSAVQEQQVTPVQEEASARPLPSAPLEASGEEDYEPTVPKQLPEGTVSKPQQQDSEQTTSEKISQGITTASEWISWGVGKGAEKAGKMISYGSTKLRQRLKPAEEARPVDPRFQKGAVYARSATSAAVSVSKYVVSKLGEATVALGRQVGPHILKKGEKLMPKSMKSEGGKAKMDGVVEVAASGLAGFGTVYMGLEGAAKALAKSLANETVATVNHKYGDQAGKLTENIVYSTGNLAMTVYNVDNLGIKAIAKRAAKDTGKAVLQEMADKNTGASVQNGATPVNGSEKR